MQTRLETLKRLHGGIEAIADAVQRLNDLGAPLRIPPIAIRFAPSKLIHGENPYSTLVNTMIFDEYVRQLDAKIAREELMRRMAA